jgi:seryl-tRNA synthetase
MIYPKTIQIDNDKLKDLLIKKGDLITAGRAKSVEIEETEKKMDEIDKLIIEEEKKVNIDDLLEKEKGVTAKVDEAIKEMNEIKKEIYERMIVQTNPALRTRHEELTKKKEELETERNKIALKAQKYNDKLIPLGRKLMKPFLTDQYEDYETLGIEEGMVMATIFSHLQEWKNNFKKK